VIGKSFRLNTFCRCKRMQQPYPYLWVHHQFCGTPPCQLGWSLTLGCVGECAVKVLAFLALVLASLEMVNALLILHPLDTHSLCSDSLLDF
jgi:hypothetical protein